MVLRDRNRKSYKNFMCTKFYGLYIHGHGQFFWRALFRPCIIFFTVLGEYIGQAMSDLEWIKLLGYEKLGRLRIVLLQFTIKLQCFFTLPISVSVTNRYSFGSKIILKRLTWTAGDMKMFGLINDVSDRLLIQDDIISINNWCKRHLMVLNVSKCNIISFSRKKVNNKKRILYLKWSS